MATQLNQQEINDVFQNVRDVRPDRSGGKRAVPFDFRRPDRISKSQLRAIHQLHDNFVRSLASSLSAYLRSYVIVNLVSVEQLSYAEFLDCLPSPTCLASLGLKPYDGSAILELNSTLIFPVLEILLGGDGKLQFNSQREVTEIEQVLLSSFFEIVLRDLQEAWKFVTLIEFIIERIETEPQFLQILAPTEAVVAVAIEIRVGDAIGMMNIAMPSIIIKMMRQRFDQQWLLRKATSSEAEQMRVMKLIQSAELQSEARLSGPQLLLRDLIDLEEGDVLGLEFPVGRLVDFSLSGAKKYRGEIVRAGNRAGFRVLEQCGNPAS